LQAWRAAVLALPLEPVVEHRLLVAQAVAVEVGTDAPLVVEVGDPLIALARRPGDAPNQIESDKFAP
jgi:hypothetical protein